MALAQEDIEKIQELIRKSIEATPEVGNANVRYELDLRERTIRVEEELKHQRELMQTGFAQMEKRFEQMEKRFEQVDKRFEQVDKRFEQVDKRFEQMHIDLNKRFEQIDKQFEKQSQAIMNIHQEIKLQMRWSFGVLMGVGGLVVGILKLTS
ncbi:MAG: hypothetical protein GQ532_00060 [Methylomarinum sp.]|nr:hypothetical protein [Methylomarinum sp.]